jgi:F0F1-type ATP synthase assembly protein I
MGWYIAMCLILGIAGGLWIDDQLHSRPLFLLLGLALGLGLAFYGVFRMVAQATAGIPGPPDGGDSQPGP